jgi:preprotein translocase SecE subunit
MAKTRAQRKAEKRRRQQAQQQRQPGTPGADAAEDEARAQHDTQAPVSGDVAEAEAVIETGARTEDYGEHVADRPADAPAPETPEGGQRLDAPAPSRADVGRTGDGEAALEDAGKESRETRRSRKEREKEERRKARAKELQKGGQAEKPEKRRGAVTGFIASCWAELKKVQWPDRDTLVQASAVTIIFVFVAAAYLGALDAAFNFIVKEILL